MVYITARSLSATFGPSAPPGITAEFASTDPLGCAGGVSSEVVVLSVGRASGLSVPLGSAPRGLCEQGKKSFGLCILMSSAGWHRQSTGFTGTRVRTSFRGILPVRTAALAPRARAMNQIRANLMDHGPTYYTVPGVERGYLRGLETCRRGVAVRPTVP
ncbi:MAG: hypothetical protein ACI9JD_001181 [Rhodococcus sp. (in: high G+C Gram-positive bacteria)]